MCVEESHFRNGGVPFVVAHFPLVDHLLITFLNGIPFVVLWVSQGKLPQLFPSNDMTFRVMDEKFGRNDWAKWENREKSRVGNVMVIIDAKLALKTFQNSRSLNDVHIRFWVICRKRKLRVCVCVPVFLTVFLLPSLRTCETWIAD